MTTTTSAPSAVVGVAGALHLDAEDGASLAALSGAWAPATADLAAELPALVAELHRRGVRVFRIAYNPARWHEAPHQVTADGRAVHLGLFRTLPPDLLILQGSHGERLDLTVPPARGTADR